MRYLNIFMNLDAKNQNVGRIKSILASYFDFLDIKKDFLRVESYNIPYVERYYVEMVIEFSTLNNIRLENIEGLITVYLQNVHRITVEDFSYDEYV